MAPCAPKHVHGGQQGGHTFTPRAQNTDRLRVDGDPAGNAQMNRPPSPRVCSVGNTKKCRYQLTFLTGLRVCDVRENRFWFQRVHIRTERTAVLYFGTRIVFLLALAGPNESKELRVRGRNGNCSKYDCCCIAWFFVPMAVVPTI